MRVRSARALAFSRHGSELIACNYLANSTFACSPDLLTLLSKLDEWSALEKIAAVVPLMAADELLETVDELVAVGALTQEGSELATIEDTYSESWNWGLPAALFHFSVQDRQYLSPKEMEESQRQKIETQPQPPLYQSNLGTDEACIHLDPGLGRNELLDLMARRRTVREVDQADITISQLSDCLFAGLGITGETANCVGKLPLSMTPSGGARNPYEAFVYAHRVTGLEPGIYHYAAIDHSLAPVANDNLLPSSELLGGQEWADDMACVVILCAVFERTMWKYDDANAYRVVLIEAGHIGQNIMLAATYHGLTACPSAALSHRKILESIGRPDRIANAPVYALALARAPATAAVSNEGLSSASIGASQFPSSSSRTSREMVLAD